MKAYMQQDKDDEMVLHQPYWIVVGEKIKKFPVYNQKGKVVSHIIEKSVKCNIAVVDCQNKDEAERIAKAVLQAIKGLE